MDVLFVGGTGIMNSASETTAVEAGHDVWTMTRGRSRLSSSVSADRALIADATDERELQDVLGGHHFDVVVQWVGYLPRQVEIDLKVFVDVGHYLFISSASAYEKPEGCENSMHRFSHYNQSRPHRGMGLEVPTGVLAVTPLSLDVHRHDLLGGLIHEYYSVAA
jgi:hypothetical protein